MRMSKVVLNYWPSLLLSLVLLAGIVSCLKRLDYLVNEEIRALISILFGFATSCLVLSFIWLMQRKPLVGPNRIGSPTTGRDVPSMHPRGRADSTDSYDAHQIVITTISNSELDTPPRYEDALINSKPIHWYYPKEHATSGVSGCVSSSNRGSFVGCECLRKKSTTSHEDGLERFECGCYAAKKLYLKSYSKLDANPYQNRECGRAQPSTAASQDQYEMDRNLRKASYVQLDVGQLIMSSSPPKYHEFFSHLDDRNRSPPS